MSGLDSLTPIAPIVPPKYLSLIGSHACPPSLLLNTPPPVVPIQYSLGRDAEPATATRRPPRKIPISRHLSAAKTVESYGAAWAGAERAGETSEPRARSAARRASTDKPPRGDDQGTHVARKRDAPQGAR